ncbi:MAG: hypothetical protein ACE5HE_11180 [Phycisphaerae bacterium]
MLKFFRKHNKTLLAVFMALLMIVFVGGQALQSLFTPETNLIVAETYLGRIETADQRRADASTRILAAMGLNWQHPMGGNNEPLTIVDWVLLTREAQRFQAQASIPSVKAWLGAREGDVDAVARRLRVKPSFIYTALKELRSVQIVAQAMVGINVPSTAEVRKAVRDALDKVRVNAVVLPAEAFVDELRQFPESALTAQLEAHLDAKPAGPLDFGYYVEPTLAVQYIKIDRAKLAASIRVPNHEKKARHYYNENREKDPAFRRPPPEPPSPDDEEPSTAEEAEAEQPSPFLTWQEGRERAMHVVREQRAEEAAEQIANWLCSYDAERWLEVERGEDLYKAAPPAVADLDYYDSMIAQVPGTIAYPEALTVVVTDEFSRAEAHDVPEIGLAVYSPGRGATRSLAALAFRSQPIVPTIPTDAGSRYADYLSLYQTCPYPLKDEHGNLYVFRVVGSTPGHSPASLAEVRDRVVKDLRLIDGYELAKSWAATLRHLEGVESLKEAYEADGELASIFAEKEGHGGGYFTSTPVARVNRDLLNAGIDTDQTYVGGGIGMVPSEVVNEWFELEYTVDHTDVYELHDRAAVLVVEWVETEPARFDEFEDMKGQLAGQLAARRTQAILADWFDPEQIRGRNGFELINKK